MNCTEAEAKLKWCPMSRVLFLGQAASNRVSTARIQAAKAEADRTGDDRDHQYFAREVADTHCLGSLCMFWKVTHGKNQELYGTCGAAPDFTFQMANG